MPEPSPQPQSVAQTTGIPLGAFAEQLTLAEASDPMVLARRFASGFFLWLGTWAKASREDETPTGRHRPQRRSFAIPRDVRGLSVDAHTARAQSAIEELPEIFLYPVRRRADSDLAFVSIGRLAGNDLAVRDDTVSKFHAYIKADPDAEGAFVLLQDGRSRNGTFVDGVRVARRGEGPPTVLRAGQHVRFGSVSMSFVDATALLQLVRTHDATRARARALSLSSDLPRASAAPTPAFRSPALLWSADSKSETNCE